MSLNNNERTAADCLLMLGTSQKDSPPSTARRSPKIPSVLPPTERTHHHVSFASPSPTRYGLVRPERRGFAMAPSSSLPPPPRRPAMMMHSPRRQRVPALHHPGIYSVHHQQSGPPPPPPPPMRHSVSSMPRSPGVRLAMRSGVPPYPPSSPYHHHLPAHHPPPHHPHHHHQQPPPPGVSPSHQQSLLEKVRPVSPNSVHSDLGDRKQPVSPDSSPRVLKTSVPGGNALSEPNLKQEQATAAQGPDGGGDEKDGEINPSPLDVLIGTGRTCSSHPGNRRFHKEIYDTCEDYFEADYKKGVVDRAIRAVHRRGGRFLTKKGDEWVVVTDHDRLERNTRKSFHMARKQRATQAERRGEEQKISSMRSPTSVAGGTGGGAGSTGGGGGSSGGGRGASSHHHHHHHHHPKAQPYEQRMLKPGVPLPQAPNKGLHVAVYSRAVGAYCVGTIEARAKNLYLLRYEDTRLGTEWVDLDKADCRVFSS